MMAIAIPLPITPLRTKPACIRQATNIIPHLSHLQNLPTDLLLPILTYLPNPAPFLQTCRTTHSLSKDTYTRATWIHSQIPITTGVPAELLAFWIGLKRNILTEHVMRVLDSMGVGVVEELPTPQWEGWRMLGTLLALRGDEAVVKLAIRMGFIKYWRTFVQAAEGAGRRGVVGVVLDHLILHSAEEVKRGSGVLLNQEDGLDNGSSEEESDFVAKPTTERTSPHLTPPTPLSDPILQHYALRHSFVQNSSTLFHKTCTIIPQSSPAWSTIAPTLFTTASPKIITTLAGFITAGRVPTSLLLMSAKGAILTNERGLRNLEMLVMCGCVDLAGKEREAGTVLVRGAALEGDVVVLGVLFELGCIPDAGTLHNAKLSGCKKCVKMIEKWKLKTSS
ncbi:hypothetical protein HDV00_010045 [Rhizophlyctis rosea]|nr:hypothetical protein HDV00_010045 [Rhizophlyctis rosea]